MNNLWWLALPVLLLPVWWHRRKRERSKAAPLATARFLPRAEPQQRRVWRWTERLLLALRCLMLFGVIALLAGLTVPWRGDTVLVVPGAEPAWLERQVSESGFAGARRMMLPASDPLGWLALHEREWRAGARLLVVGSVPMPAVQPRFRHRVELRTATAPFAKTNHHVAIVSKRPGQWRALFAALDGPQRYLVTDTPDAQSELIVWDLRDAPPAGMRAPLWWIGDSTAFPELGNAPSVDGVRYADSARGRLWTSDAWPPRDADAARKVFETWQQLHYVPVAYTLPSQVLAPAGSTPVASEGSLRDQLLLVLAILFAIERILTHARRR
ncbi:MAG: hypothetical protein JWP34_3810 [Massilia sp.]|nr:hypothetical protein [Massilia sp.]